MRVEIYIDYDQDGRLDPTEGISGLQIEAETSSQTWRGVGWSEAGVAILHVPFDEQIYISIPYLQESQSALATEEKDGRVSFEILPPLLPIELP